MHCHEVLDGEMGLGMCWLQVLGWSGCVLNIFGCVAECVLIVDGGCCLPLGFLGLLCCLVQLLVGIVVSSSSGSVGSGNVVVTVGGGMVAAVGTVGSTLRAGTSWVMVGTGALGSTLRAGASWVFGGSTLRAGASWVLVLAAVGRQSCNTSMILCRAAVWLSVNGANGEFVVGFWRAWVISAMPA